MADSKVAKPCAAAKEMLKYSLGRRRVKIEDLGPALFNRFGGPRSARHASKLMTRIVDHESFAEYRYNSVWAHTANPANPSEVYEHALSMTSNDPLLPRFKNNALLGCFRCNHLLTGLLMVDQGRTYKDNSSELLHCPADELEIAETLREGIVVEVE